MPVDEAPPSQERRSLAAIVFTDVVGFSRHAAADEGRTFAEMNRDFALFTRLCGERGGRVANTAGDSMLMIFGSAVDAMECALAIQAALHAQTKANPAEGALEHRIGVHIGDVILNGTNVFGDGVNVASRIEEICRPGAVAYSRAVSEIVHGKVQAKGVYLGPRRAKNIGEAIPVWEVPPIALQERARMEAAMIAPMMHAPREEGITGRRSVVALTLAGLLLAGAFALMLTFRSAGGRETRRPAPGRVQPQRRPLTSPSTSVTNSPANVVAPETNAPDANATNTTNAGGLTSAGILDLRNRLQEMKTRYDFEGILALLQSTMKGPMTASDGNAIGPVVRRYETLAVLRQWADNELKALPMGATFTLSDGTVVDDATGTPTIRGKDSPATTLDLWNLSPDRVHSVLVGLDDRPDRSFPCPAGAIDAFADEYGIGVGSPLL